MDERRLIETMHEQLGLSNRRARNVVGAIAGALGAALPAADRQLLAARVPVLRRGLLGSGSGRGLATFDAFVTRVADQAHLARGRALEAAQVACQELGDALDEELRAHLDAHLPPGMLALFARREVTEPVPRQHLGRRVTGLAEGRPGSGRPLSEAAPGHREAVARSPDPHADTKLSSSPGVASERRHDTLAEGRPGSKRPLSEGDE